MTYTEKQLINAFVQGAEWERWTSNETAYASERKEDAEAEAAKRLATGKLGQDRFEELEDTHG